MTMASDWPQTQQVPWDFQQPSRRVPYRCPICEGHGLVPGGFYSAVPGGQMISCNATEQCRACGGTGIIYA